MRKYLIQITKLQTKISEKNLNIIFFLCNS